MELLSDLWLPILMSAVFVFIVSSIIHMALQIHKKDFRKLPGEDSLLEAMRTQGITHGDYIFPCPGSMKELTSPDMIEKFKRGPVGNLTIRPSGPPAMGKSLLQWFLYSLLLSLFAAYVASLGLDRGADYLEVFRITGTVAILGYATAYIPDAIWKGASWKTTAKFALDGIVYGLVTAGTFGWLWPSAS